MFDNCSVYVQIEDGTRLPVKADRTAADQKVKKARYGLMVYVFDIHSLQYLGQIQITVWRGGV